MSETTADLPASDPVPARTGRRLHPVQVWLMHWANALAMLVMIGSGWGIYNDCFILGGLHFAKGIKLGSWYGTSPACGCWW